MTDWQNISADHILTFKYIESLYNLTGTKTAKNKTKTEKKKK